MEERKIKGPTFVKTAHFAAGILLADAAPASISETGSMNQDLKDHFLNVLKPLGKTWWLLAACLLFSGCEDNEAIRIYDAPKEQSLASTGKSEPQELLGALIANDSRPWAFKMMGDPEKVALYRSDFRNLVDSLSFGSNGEPNWKLPESWREEAGNEFTYRTFRPPNDPSIKATISELSYNFSPTDLSAPNWQEYVLQNVNRWRGQLLLEDQAWDEMSSTLEPIEKLSLRDLPAYYVSLKGESSGRTGPMMGGPMMGGPMMGGQTAGGPPMSASASQPADKSNETLPTKNQLQATVPDGWTEVAPLSIMAWKSYEAQGPDGTKAQITFTPAGGDSLSNVMRWSGQIGGSEEQAAKAIENMEKLEVNGKPTELYKLVGPDPNPKATTAAIVQWTSSQSLFVKMSGPAAAVNANNDAFLALLKSIKW